MSLFLGHRLIRIASELVSRSQIETDRLIISKTERQSISQSVSQSVNQSVSRSVRLSARLSIRQSVS